MMNLCFKKKKKLLIFGFVLRNDGSEKGESFLGFMVGKEGMKGLILMK